MRITAVVFLFLMFCSCGYQKDPTAGIPIPQNAENRAMGQLDSMFNGADTVAFDRDTAIEELEELMDLEINIAKTQANLLSLAEHPKNVVFNNGVGMFLNHRYPESKSRMLALHKRHPYPGEAGGATDLSVFMFGDSLVSRYARVYAVLDNATSTIDPEKLHQLKEILLEDDGAIDYYSLTFTAAWTMQTKLEEQLKANSNQQH